MKSSGYSGHDSQDLQDYKMNHGQHVNPENHVDVCDGLHAIRESGRRQDQASPARAAAFRERFVS